VICSIGFVLYVLALSSVFFVVFTFSVSAKRLAEKGASKMTNFVSRGIQNL